MTNDFVYRTLITDDDITAYHELEELFRNPVTSTWMDPGAHVVCYSLKDSNTYNFVFICDTPLNTQ